MPTVSTSFILSLFFPKLVLVYFLRLCWFWQWKISSRNCLKDRDQNISIFLLVGPGSSFDKNAHTKSLEHPPSFGRQHTHLAPSSLGLSLLAEIMLTSQKLMLKTTANSGWTGEVPYTSGVLNDRNARAASFYRSASSPSSHLRATTHSTRMWTDKVALRLGTTQEPILSPASIFFSFTKRWSILSFSLLSLKKCFESGPLESVHLKFLPTIKASRLPTILRMPQPPPSPPIHQPMFVDWHNVNCSKADA